MPAIITLTTAWGAQNFLSAVIQHRLEVAFGLKVVVLSHSVSKYNNNEAAWQVKNASLILQEPAIHFIDIESVYSTDQSRILIESDDQVFICRNNGIISLLGKSVKKAYHLPGTTDSLVETLLEQFDLALNNKSSLSECENITELTSIQIIEDATSITGIILVEDIQGHLHTNIAKSEISKKGWNLETINIITQKKGQLPFVINKPKSDLLKKQDILTGYNYEENLIIWFNEGLSSALLGLNPGDNIKIVANKL